MNFKQFMEAHHAYDIDSSTPPSAFQPVKRGDTLRVFHGFNSFRDAYIAATRGLSGRNFADRRYAYESDNNPYGLFVTLEFKKAAEFTSAASDEVIMEFNAKEEDLEAPVWPGGSYTVQGGMSQYFGRWPAGKRKRQDAHKAAEKEWEKTAASRPLPHIQQSDNKHKAGILTNSSEYQALFIGDLAPQNIVAFHIRPLPYDYRKPWQRLSREEFLERYKDYKVTPNYNSNYEPPSEPIFLPDEDFEETKFLNGLGERFGQSPEELMDSLRSIWRMATAKHNAGSRVSSYQSHVKHFLWPKQIMQSFKWLKGKFK